MRFFSLKESVDMGNLTGWPTLKPAASGTTVVESLRQGDPGSVKDLKSDEVFGLLRAYESRQTDSSTLENLHLGCPGS